MNRADQHPVPLHLSQRLSQHLLTDPRHLAGKLRETQFAMLVEDFENDHRPLVSDPADQIVDQGLYLWVGIGGWRLLGNPLRGADGLIAEGQVGLRVRGRV